MRDLPDAAITEAVKAAWDSEYAYARNRKPDGGGHTMPHRDVFHRMLVAAAPVIAAAAAAESATAEREAIAANLEAEAEIGQHGWQARDALRSFARRLRELGDGGAS